MTNAEKLAKIDAILKEIPSFNCKPGCADCCGPVQFSRLEYFRILGTSGRSAKDIRQRMAENIKQKNYQCPMLDKKTMSCSVYEVRPAICRLFGTTKGLACPHGCSPSPTDMLSEKRTREILALVDEIGK